MTELNIDKAKFHFQYLPDFAKFILKEKLEEFVTVGIRFCRELDLPMMRPLAKMSEEELCDLSRDSNKEILTALAKNDITPFIEKNVINFVNNKIHNSKGEKLLDRSEILTEDLILAFYIRRKLFAFFLHSYTQNAVVHMLISAELDSYTTQEHLLTIKGLLSETAKS
jgi:hypothetical protein